MEEKQKNKNFKLSASLICADLMNLNKEIKSLELGGIDQVHFDVMDGHFVPRLGLHPEILKYVTSITRLPVDVHLMISNPDKFIPNFVEAGANLITIHAESTLHLHYSIKTIKDLGVKVGVALNITTPLNVLDYILDDIDLVLLMAINPGIVGHKLIQQTIKKISGLKEKLSNHPNIEIQIDGGVNPKSAPDMINAGATILVCGTSSIFKKDKNVNEQIKLFRKTLSKDIEKTEK